MGVTLSSLRVAVQMAGVINLSVDGGLVLPAASVGIQLAPAVALANGSGANQAQHWWQSTARALASGANETLGLYNFSGLNIGAGSGDDPLGQPMTLAAIVGILVHNDASSAGSLLVGGDGTSACWTSLLNGSNTAVIGPLHADAWFAAFDPSALAFPVANTTNMNLKIAATGGAVTYDIYILAR